jgi:Na+-translocating ferredoxin:NAD+ oxidoreductase RnfE subunit
MTLWPVGYLLTREVNAANAFGSIVTILFVLFMPDTWIAAILPGVTPAAVRMYAALMIAMILLRLFEPVRDYIEALRKRGNSP